MAVRQEPYHPSMRGKVLAFLSQVFVEMGHDFDLLLKDRDLANIPAVYQHSGGGFWILRDGTDGPVIGTAALRQWDGECAEFKRFYVLESWRGVGLGKRLLETAIAHACDHGFTHVRLDTTAKSAAAIRRFEVAGFKAIERYHDDPHAELFFELQLGPGGTGASSRRG